MSEQLTELEVVHDQPCPMCGKNTLSLTQAERDIPFFGKVYVFSMSCVGCKYHKADIECAEEKDPCKYTLEVDSVDDMNIRIIKSASATVKIPFIATIESTEASNGYVTNVEGLLNRVKRIIEMARDDSEDQADKKKAKNLLKKLMKVRQGDEKLKIIIEDKTGNSAIISEKAKRSSLKK